jgi:hypothetical protein
MNPDSLSTVEPHWVEALGSFRGLAGCPFERLLGWVNNFHKFYMNAPGTEGK